MRRTLLIAALCSSATASASFAAQPDDAWLALAGCWRAEGDTSQRSLCIVPDGEGVRMITLNAGKIETESRIVADGQPRAISQEGCSGNETALWSTDRQRVFINAEMNCGNNVTRKVSGMFAVLSSSQWVSVQTVTTAGNTSVHKVRYVETDPENVPSNIAQTFSSNRLARQTVRIGASSPLDLADIKNAVLRVDTAVVQGWLTAVNQEFDLDAKALIELDDAGVPPSVIDVLIAVSNPRYFAVRDVNTNERDPRRGRGRGRAGGCYDTYWYDPYNPFGYRGHHDYYDHCRGGIGVYPGWGGYWGGGSVIVINRGGGLRDRGKVTREGYKAPRDDTSTASGTSVSDAVKSTTKASGGTTSSGSSDDSSSSTGRKAKPRDN